MLSKDQFFNVNAGYDQYGRARGTGYQWETGRVDALGRQVLVERAGREAADLLQQDVDEAERMRRSAPHNDLATEADRAWADLKVAQCHLLLVEKFERDSADWRVEANRLAAMPGGMQRSDLARRQAERLAAIAQRHREAAATRQAQGQQEFADVRKKMPKPPAHSQQPHPAQPPGGAMPRPRTAGGGGRREPLPAREPLHSAPVGGDDGGAS